MAFLAIYGYSLVSILQSLSVVVGGKYEEGPRIIWAVKGGGPIQQARNAGEVDPTALCLERAVLGYRP